MPKPSGKKLKRRQTIQYTIEGLIADFLYYGRKEDEDLPRGEIEAAVKAGEITVEEMVDLFAKKLREGLE
jgi:hypothetical protein